MPVKHYIVGTAGHIDHGKSSLVKALTGTDPDRLPEEKARGMTIDLGFAHLSIPDSKNSQVTYDVGLIDVPGHADFVKNMVAGVGSIDVALFIVAADDGWMPQSEEHLQILSYLGVKRGIIALTKADLTDDVEFCIELLRESIKDTVFENAPIIPTAATQGRGLEELKEALAEVLRTTLPPVDIGKPRLPVDRTFSPAGIGTVVTGTLTGGTLEKGQAAVIQPGGLKTHIRNVQNHSKDSTKAVPGTRTALNLADVAIANRIKKEGVNRGDVVTLPNLGEPCHTLDVLLEKSLREVPGHPLAIRPLRNGQKIYWHHGGAHEEARVYFLGQKTLGPGQQVLAQLRFREPVYAFMGDRFVLRDFSKQATVAGGLILEPDANRAAFRKVRHRTFLEKRAANPDDVQACLLSLVQRDSVIPKTNVLPKTRFSASAVQSAVAKLTSTKALLAEGNWLLDSAWWEKRLEAAGNLIKAHHKANPQLQGMDITEISNAVSEDFPDRKLMDFLIGCLAKLGFVKNGNLIRFEGHTLALPPQLVSSGERIRQILDQNPLEPPNPGELAPTPADKQALKFLLDSGAAVYLDEKAVVSRASFDSMKQKVVEHLKEHKQATVSDLRQVLGTSRRIAVPLMEKLDREGVTRRNGDLRILKQI